MRTVDQKARIRRTAAELWARKGYHGAGVQELARATDLGKGALYHHIGSKEQLLYEISISSVSDLVVGAEEVLAMDAPAAERLRLLSRRLMRKIADDLPEWKVFFHEVNTLTGANRRTVMEFRERYEDLWGQLLQEGAAAGEFGALDPLAVKGVLGMHNYSYLWIRQNGRLEPEDVADMFVDILLDGLRVRGSSR
jgi:AcrR family transcriptional regulator